MLLLFRKLLQQLGVKFVLSYLGFFYTGSYETDHYGNMESC